MNSAASSNVQYPPDFLSWLLVKFSTWLLPKPDGASPFVWFRCDEWRGFAARLKDTEQQAARLEFRTAWPPVGKSFAPCGDISVNYEVSDSLDMNLQSPLKKEALHIISKLALLQTRLPEIASELFPGLEEGAVRWASSPLPLGRKMEEESQKDVMIKLNELPCGLQCAFCTRSKNADRHDVPKLHLIDQLYRSAVSLGRPHPLLDFLRIGTDEPTFHPYLLSFVSLAKHLGYKKISLQTAAAGLKSVHEALVLAEAGLSDVQMPLYGLTPEIHDTVVNCPGHFRHITDIMEAFRSAGTRVSVHSVPTLLNQADIAALPQWCRERGLQFHGFMFPRLEGPGRLPAEKLIPKLSELHPEIRRRLDLLIPCLDIGTYESSPGDRNAVREIVSGSGTSSKASFECFYAPQCPDCTKRSLCSGVYRGYLELYGVDEFVPVKS